MAAIDDFPANKTTSGVLQPGSQATGVFEAYSDSDWFKVALTAGSYYTFKVGTALGERDYPGIELHDASGSVLFNPVQGSLNATGAGKTYKVTQSGDYYVAAVNQNGLPPGRAYILSATRTIDNAGDTSATALPITPGKLVSGAFEFANDSDLFKVTLAEGTTYMVNTTWPLFWTDRSNMTVYSPDGSNAIKSNWADSGTSMSFSSGAAGDYVIDLRGVSAAAYTVRIDAAADDVGASIARAGNLSLGSTVRGNIEVRFDRDWYGSDLKAGVTYWFTVAVGTLSNGSYTGPSLVNKVLLLDGGGKQVAALLNSKESNQVLAFTPTVDGRYYLEVSDTGARTGDYTVKAAVGVADDIGDDAAGAAAMQADSQVAGRLAIATDKDVFRIALEEGKTYLFDLAGQRVTSGASLTLNTVKEVSTYLIDIHSYAKPGGGMYQVVQTFSSGDYLVTVDNRTDIGTASYTLKTTTLTTQPGGDGNDYVTGYGTGMRLDGGGGLDTALYFGVRGAYAVTRNGGESGVALLNRAPQYEGDRLAGVERLQFMNTSIALDVDGTAGQAYRLYQAAFNRAPDKPGLGFWIRALDQGAPLEEAANGFVGSKEFATLYGGAPSDQHFVNALYRNVLHRLPDDEGLDFWIQALQNGVSRASVLVSFSESPENQAALLPMIGQGFEYTPYG